MGPEPLSADELTRFIRDHVGSVWTLELLLLLRRDPARCWPAPDLVRELRASTSLVATTLQKLERSELVIRDDSGCYRYAPANAVLDEMCGQLEAAYRERPVAVVNLIARPADPLQSLADAFKFRGDGK